MWFIHILFEIHWESNNLFLLSKSVHSLSSKYRISIKNAVVKLCLVLERMSVCITSDLLLTENVFCIYCVYFPLFICSEITFSSLKQLFKYYIVTVGFFKTEIVFICSSNRILFMKIQL